jgi:hypothetical protein
MRFLETDEMLCLLPADKMTEQEALARGNFLFTPANGWDKDRLPELVQAGALKTASIHREGAAVCCVWYRVERERLIVDTMIALEGTRSTQEAWQAIWGGVENLAHTFGCNSVEGVTARAALARVYLRNGFEARGVLMRKAINV